jgi:hypothetical protein
VCTLDIQRATNGTAMSRSATVAGIHLFHICIAFHVQVSMWSESGSITPEIAQQDPGIPLGLEDYT